MELEQQVKNFFSPNPAPPKDRLSEGTQRQLADLGHALAACYTWTDVLALVPQMKSLILWAPRNARRSLSKRGAERVKKALKGKE